MIKKEEIVPILENYKKEEITIATVCSHTALQIFHGARKEGFKTLGIVKPNVKEVYESFKLGGPDKFLEVDDYKKMLEPSFQKKLTDENAIIIPHGSFVEYVGAKNIEDELLVPMFGNREVLGWESDRSKERIWLERAGLRMPVEFKSASDIDRTVMVKFPGAKGGAGYFLAKDEKEFHKKLKKVKGMSECECTLQEYIVGTRFYPHYFYSQLTGENELMSMDIRYESNIEGLVRVPKLSGEIEPSFVVTGNTPVIARESLLPKILSMGEKVIDASEKLFSPGLYGPYCLETICTDNLEFVTFEVSARIVAGTNLYPMGSQYSCYRYSEPMSTGRRIAREIRTAVKKDLLEKIIY